MRSRPITSPGATEATGSGRTPVSWRGWRGWRGTTVIGVLLAAVAALVAAFVLAPAALLSLTCGADDSEATLRDALGRAFAEWGRSATPVFPAHLSTLVDYWLQWHAIKVVISALAVMVLVLLSIQLWRRYLRVHPRYAPGCAALAIATTVAIVLVVGVLMLNIQATAVPLVALLPLLPDGTADATLAPVVSAMREELAGSPAGSPALRVLLGEVERYHWDMVTMSAPLMVATGLASACACVWTRRTAADPSAARVRFMHSTLAAITALTAGLLLLVSVANVLSALEPATWLLGVIDAG